MEVLAAQQLQSLSCLLEASDHPITYTFTDISSSLVRAAKKRFTGHPQLKFKVLDIEAMPTSSLFSSQDVIIAANVIHAAKSIKDSCTNILKMLEKQGILCLIEVTRKFLLVRHRIRPT